MPNCKHVAVLQGPQWVADSKEIPRFVRNDEIIPSTVATGRVRSDEVETLGFAGGGGNGTEQFIQQRPARGSSSFLRKQESTAPLHVQLV